MELEQHFCSFLPETTCRDSGVVLGRDVSAGLWPTTGRRPFADADQPGARVQPHQKSSFAPAGGVAAPCRCSAWRTEALLVSSCRRSFSRPSAVECPVEIAVRPQRPRRRAYSALPEIGGLGRTAAARCFPPRRGEPPGVCSIFGGSSAAWCSRFAAPSEGDVLKELPPKIEHTGGFPLRGGAENLSGGGRCGQGRLFRGGAE